MSKSQKASALFFFVSFLFTTFVHGANWSSSSYEEDNSPLSKAKSEIREKNYDSAIKHLQATLKVEKNNADAYNLLGYSNRKLKRFDIAETYYLKALTLDPEHQGALEYLGELYVETNRISKAKEMLARLDDACFFFCSEYRQLKAKIEEHEAPQVSSKVEATEEYSMGYYTAD